MELDATNVSQVLTATIPEIRSLEEAIRSSKDASLSNYSFFADVVRPYMFDLLRSEAKKGKLDKLFSFFEEMACANSSVLKDVLLIEIISPLAGRKDDLQAALPYMGKHTKDLVHEMRKGSFRLWMARTMGRLLGR